ncbi:MAG: flippase-like domain-containing protein [Ktedonobacteraceae bacterium]|nr:flippase-like domain-containing protein [Ktedonobacteraceae bacterium]
MSVSPQPPPRYTRLRDFGALQADVSTLVTRKTVALGAHAPQDMPPAVITPRPLKDCIPGDAAPHTPAALTMSRQPSAFQMQADGTVTIIPFQMPPASQARGEWPGNQQALAASQRVGGGKRGRLALRVALTIVLFALLFRSLSWGLVVNALLHVHHAILLLGLVVGAASLIASAYQWRSLLYAERMHFDLAELINLYVVGIAFSHFLPTGIGGDVVKALYTGRAPGDNERAFSAVIMSRVTGFVGMLVMATTVLVLWRASFSAPVALGFALLALLVTTMIASALCSAIWLPRLLRGRRAAPRILGPVLRTGTALLTAFRRPRSLCIATLFGMFFWALACLNYYGYATALDIHVPLYFYFVAIPLISLITLLPISINGFGLRETALVYVLATVHVPSTTALLLGLLVDVQALLFGLIGGCIYLTISGKKAIRMGHE